MSKLIKLSDLPDIDTCEKSVYDCRFIGTDGYQRKQRKTYVRKNPFNKHKNYVISLIRDMTDEDFKTFFKDNDWEDYDN